MNTTMKKALLNISKAVESLSATKIKVYTKVWGLEQMYEDLCERDVHYAISNPKFKTFITTQIPMIDYMDYLKFKGFVANGLSMQVLLRISDDALNHIRMRTVVRGVVHPDFKKFFNKLPKKGPITWEISRSVFEDIRPERARSAAPASAVALATVGYTKKNLQGYTKVELVNIIMSLQRKVNATEIKLDNARLVSTANKRVTKRRPTTLAAK